MFQAEGPLIHYLFSEQVSLLHTVNVRFLKKEAVAGFTTNLLAKVDIELWKFGHILVLRSKNKDLYSLYRVGHK